MGLGEVAAAFAGFSGVVAALGSRSRPSWPPPARFRFVNLLVASVAAALFAFLPVAMALSAMSSSVVWASSSVALALFSIYFLVDRLRAGRRILTRFGGLRRWSALVFTVVLVSVIALQISNLVGFPFDRGGAFYVAGVLGLLVVSAYQFVLLALDSVTEPEPSED